MNRLFVDAFMRPVWNCERRVVHQANSGEMTDVMATETFMLHAT